MDEFPDIQNLLTKLKSSLPICRICLEISMEYIEFEGTLCVVDGEEITYSDGFNEIACSPTIELPNELLRSFCVKCGNDLLNAYLFLKRVENANFILNRVKRFNEESTKLEDEYSAVVLQSESDCVEEDLKEELLSVGPDSESDDDVQASPISNEISIKSENEEPFDIESEGIVGDEFNSANTSTKEDMTVSSLVVDTDFASGDENEAEDNNSNEKLEWICDECGQAYDTKYSLAEHYKEHKPNESCCLQCNSFFANSAELDNHMLVHEYSESVMDDSDKTVHYRCTLCETNWHTEAEFVDHINAHRDKKLYVCDICSNAFHTKLNLHVHKCHVHINYLKRKKIKERENSPHCQRVVNKAHTEKNIAANTSTKDLPCPDCDKKFTTKLGLKAHSVIHKPRKFVCHICDKVCLTDFTLRKHIQYIHMTDRMKHQCEDCGLFFQYPSYLRDHQRKHNAKSRFKCPHCDRSYCRKPQLDIHMRYHTNDFRYKCDQCDKCYVTKSNLMDHVRSAHFKVTYDCNECDQKFKSVTGLRKHKYTHTGYPYSCPLCLIGQTSRSGMKAHLFGVHKDSVTEEGFNEMFPIIIPKTGYRRPRDV